MTVALIPGSFDPVTNGHMELFSRASSVFDQLVIAVAVNPNKQGWLAPGQRVELLEKSLSANLNDVSARVVLCEGLLAELATEIGANAIVKGVRSAADLESESAQAEVNRDISGVETLLLPATSGFSRLSSSLVRELFWAGGNVEKYVPAPVSEFLDTIRPHRLNAAHAGFSSNSDL